MRLSAKRQHRRRWLRTGSLFPNGGEVLPEMRFRTKSTIEVFLSDRSSLESLELSGEIISSIKFNWQCSILSKALNKHHK